MMHAALLSHDADLLYGNWRRVQDVPILDTVSPRASRVVSDNPFRDILRFGCVGMAVMAKRDLFKRAGGADDRLFVQDQSLALRLGFHAKRLVRLETTVVYARACDYSLSRNLALQHHDGFYAFKYALQEFSREERRLYAKMVSVLWKAKRSHIFWWPFFLFYGLVKWLRPKPFGVAWLTRRADKLMASDARNLSCRTRSA